MTSWCGDEPWGPYTNDTLDFTPCFREVALETVVPLSFIILTLTLCGARPLLQRCIGSTLSKSEQQRNQQQQQQSHRRGQDTEQSRHPSSTSPLLSHPQDPYRYEGYSSTTHYNAIDPRVSNGRSTRTGTHLGSTLQQDSFVAKKQAAETGATEDAALLLQCKDHSDQDPRPESFVNHPTIGDAVLILVALVQALSFLLLVVVRWRFLEVGGHHGQPGHIHLPAYRFIMPVAQSIAWSYAFVLCMLAAFTRHIVRPSRIRRMLIVYAGFTMIVALLRTRTSFRFYWGLDDIPDETTPQMYQRAKAEFGLSLLNLLLASLFAFVILTTNKGPQVYFEGHKLSAETNASFFRWITYNWMNEIMWNGYEQTLELELLPSLTDQMRARPMYRAFARTRLYIKDKMQQPSLFWRMYVTNRRDIWINFVFGVVSSIAAFGVPYCMQLLLVYIEDREGPTEHAYMYVFGMLICDIVKSLTFGQNLYYGRRVDVRLRAMLSAEIYAKSLRRKDMTGIVTDSTKKGARSDTGMITNLMAVDTNRIASLGSSIFMLYTCPIEIALGIIMLYYILGLSSLVGLGVMLLTTPIHHFATKKYAKIQDQLMETRDRRVGLMSELLQGIRMIKFFAWENNIQKKIMEVRDQELRRFVRLYIINAIFTLLWFGSPILVTVMSFTSYTKLEGKELTPSVAFTSMVIFIILRGPLNLLPGMITDLLEAMVSIRRITAFLNEGEIWKYSENVAKDVVPEASILSPMSVSQQIQTTMTIGCTNASFRWHTKVSNSDTSSSSGPSSSGAFMLKDITLNFPVGKLSLICGATGSGKTSLIMALLREMDLISGSVNFPRATSKAVNPATGYIPGAIAYVSQYPWLQQASIRDNILFGSPYEAERYQQVLEACALLPDLSVFEHGDLTEIGEKGITLSGGQKQRVALGRAIYSRAQNLLFDDCLSAVDAHTARHLFENCLMGPIVTGRTRILVTHHVRLCLRDATYIALLKDGSLALTGSPVKLIRSGMLSEILERNGMMEEDKEASSSSTLAADHSVLSKDPSIRCSNSPKANPVTKKAKKLIDDEARAKGKVKLLVYNMYLKACGGIGFWAVLVFILAVVRVLGMMEVLWLGEWTSKYSYGNETLSRFPSHGDERIPEMHTSGATDIFGALGWKTPVPPPDHDDDGLIDLDYYIGIYCFITLMTVFLTIVRMFWQFYGSLRASRALYEQLLVAILRAPIRFFDTTPVGRIINRFSRDFEIIDGQMMYKMVNMLWYIFGIITVVLLITFVTPGFLIAATFIAVAYLAVGAYYIASSRELKRIESVTKSPLYSHFGETLVGVSTIRAFGVESRFMEEVLTKVDDNNTPFYFLWMCNRWLSIRVDFMGAMVTFCAGLLILNNLEDLDASWAGVSLGAAISFMEYIYWLVRIYTEMEMSLNSVERVHDYLQMPQEPPAIIKSSRPPAGWPYSGTIEIKDLTMQYAPDLGPVLHNISIDIRPREKIGIVGRTGSGKSTLALSLFRFMEPTSGSIVIDGIDIAKLGLEDLRRRLTIIPQDAVLFNGTIRSNLDPFQEHEDYEIWEALRRVHLVKSRGSRSGSTSSSPSQKMNHAAFYQNHQNYQPPNGGNHHFMSNGGLHHPFGTTGSPHPHQHHHANGQFHAAMDPEVAAAAAEFSSQMMDDPFHPPSVAPSSAAVFSPNSQKSAQNGMNNSMANSVLCSPFAHQELMSPVPTPVVAGARLTPEIAAGAAVAPAAVSLDNEQVDPFECLDSPVSDGGHNFSQGQRQLLCMARALLRQSKVIIMDEATASVDFATDEKIQTTIRNELGDSTLITVAHRLRTIMDYDRVLVLEQGHVVEFDSPINLITNPSSRFRDMVEKSGECDALFEMAVRAY